MFCERKDHGGWGNNGKTWYQLVGGLNPSEKYESQLGWLFPIYGKNKHVPNNQPVLALVYLPATSIDYIHQGNSITKRKTDPISRDVATTSWIARLSPYHQSHDLDGHLFFFPAICGIFWCSESEGYVGICWDVQHDILEYVRFFSWPISIVDKQHNVHKSHQTSTWPN